MVQGIILVLLELRPGTAACHRYWGRHPPGQTSPRTAHACSAGLCRCADAAHRASPYRPPGVSPMHLAGGPAAGTAGLAGWTGFGPGLDAQQHSAHHREVAEFGQDQRQQPGWRRPVPLPEPRHKPGAARRDRQPSRSWPRQMIARALDAVTPANWVAGDEVYGADPGLRAGLEHRQLGYVLAVARACQGTPGPAPSRSLPPACVAGEGRQRAGPGLDGVADSPLVRPDRW
jgi:hypothetical protein